MMNDIKKTVVSENELNSIVKKIAENISADFQGKNPLFLGLLKGCNPFMSDLIKYVTIPCTLDYMKVSSYEGSESTGSVKIKGDKPTVANRNVILVDDILDTGRTLQAVKEVLFSLGAKSIATCVLLDKPEGRVVDIAADYVGTNVPNEFVVGYGLDYNEYYRNLPYIGVLKEEIYSK